MLTAAEALRAATLLTCDVMNALEELRRTADRRKSTIVNLNRDALHVMDVAITARRLNPDHPDAIALIGIAQNLAAMTGQMAASA